MFSQGRINVQVISLLRRKPKTPAELGSRPFLYRWIYDAQFARRPARKILNPFKHAIPFSCGAVPQACTPWRINNRAAGKSRVLRSLNLAPSPPFFFDTCRAKLACSSRLASHTFSPRAGVISGVKSLSLLCQSPCGVPGVCISHGGTFFFFL